jgi:hypothetical protein
MLSVLVWPKTIPLSGVYCNYLRLKKNIKIFKNFKQLKKKTKKQMLYLLAAMISAFVNHKSFPDKDFFIAQ